ncbi:MAG: bifunctional pyr operon transcriptional regulator/uracil phosphoribosyltransferase PyrR [Bacillota bacterium]
MRDEKQLQFKKEIMDKEEMSRSITRIAHEIIEKNKGTKDLAIVGIRTRGVPLAKRLANRINEIEKIGIPYGILDITLYRDDLSQVANKPQVKKTEIDFDITDKKIVLADDVLYTGRTARAAMDALIDFGRPRSIQLAIMIDRGHRELPIRADYVGKNIPTARNEVIEVKFKETDGKDKVFLMEKIE